MHPIDITLLALAILVFGGGGFLIRHVIRWHSPPTFTPVDADEASARTPTSLVGKVRIIIHDYVLWFFTKRRTHPLSWDESLAQRERDAGRRPFGLSTTRTHRIPLPYRSLIPYIWGKEFKDKRYFTWWDLFAMKVEFNITENWIRVTNRELKIKFLPPRIRKFIRETWKLGQLDYQVPLTSLLRAAPGDMRSKLAEAGWFGGMAVIVLIEPGRDSSPVSFLALAKHCTWRRATGDEDEDAPENESALIQAINDSIEEARELHQAR